MNGAPSLSGTAVFHNEVRILIGKDIKSLKDVTAMFPPMEMISIHYEDPISFQADTLEITFEDIGSQIIKGSLAKKGMWMKIKIIQHNRDYPGSVVMKDLGSFQIDQIKHQWPPTQTTLMGTSVPIDEQIKLTLQNKQRLTTSLKDLCQQVATENHLAFKWDSSRPDRPWTTADQWNESDLTMLSKYLRNNAMSMRVKDINGVNTLVVFDEQEYEKKPPVYTIDFLQPGAGIQLTHGELTTQSQDIYSTAHLTYYDPNTNTFYVAKVHAPPGTADGTDEYMNTFDHLDQDSKGTGADVALKDEQGD